MKSAVSVPIQKHNTEFCGLIAKVIATKFAHHNVCACTDNLSQNMCKGHCLLAHVCTLYLIIVSWRANNVRIPLCLTYIEVSN